MKRKRSAQLTAALVVLTALGAAGTASADPPSTKPSCLGFEASGVSPPGSSTEFPGGVPELVGVVHGLAAEAGIPPGAIVGSIAKLHEGSHEACDEATE
jgi:hypothetical protein